MSLLAAVALALVVLAAMTVLFRLPRAAALACASALLLGLAGYALQSEADKPSMPVKAAQAGQKQDGSPLIEARKLFFEERLPAPSYMILADGFTRQGQYAEAAEILRGALADHPGDGEAWVALGNALVAHCRGTLSEPARLAYRRAAETAPESLAPGFFLGVAELQAGKLVEAYELWAGALRTAPPDAIGRAALEQRTEQLVTLMRQIAAGQ